MIPEPTDLIGRPLAVGDRIVAVARRREGSKSTCLATARIVDLTPDGKLHAALETLDGAPASGTRHWPYPWRTFRLPCREADLVMLRMNDWQPFGDRDHIKFRQCDTKTAAKESAPEAVDFTGRPIPPGSFVLFKVYKTFLALGVASHTDRGGHLIVRAKLIVLGNLRRPDSVEYTIEPQHALALPCDDATVEVFLDLVS